MTTRNETVSASAPVKLTAAQRRAFTFLAKHEHRAPDKSLFWPEDWAVLRRAALAASKDGAK